MEWGKIFSLCEGSTSTKTTCSHGSKATPAPLPLPIPEPLLEAEEEVPNECKEYRHKEEE